MTEYRSDTERNAAENVQLHPAIAQPDKPNSYLRDAARLATKILDLKLCLQGSPSSNRWQELKRELDRLQSERKHALIWGSPKEAYPAAKYVGAEESPRNLNDLIPDL